jgi:hypothetical protein
MALVRRNLLKDKSAHTTAISSLTDGSPGCSQNGHGATDNGCGDIRIANAGWSWSNLPNWQHFTKKAGCFTGNDNEIRFLIYGYQNLVAGQDYYFQHLFKDEKWANSGGTQRGIGKITSDTYHDADRWYGSHDGIAKDYHGVFCIPNNNDVAFQC